MSVDFRLCSVSTKEEKISNLCELSVLQILDNLREQNKMRSLIVETAVRKSNTTDLLERFATMSQQSNETIDEMNLKIRPQLIELSDKVPEKVRLFLFAMMAGRCTVRKFNLVLCLILPASRTARCRGSVEGI